MMLKIKLKGSQMSYVGFIHTENGGIREYLPSNEQLQNDREKRIMFFHLYNTYVEQEMTLSREEIDQGENIHEVFCNKINQLLQVSSAFPAQNIQKIFKVDIASTTLE